jgi:hypothetical protein
LLRYSIKHFTNKIIDDSSHKSLAKLTNKLPNSSYATGLRNKGLDAYSLSY